MFSPKVATFIASIVATILTLIKFSFALISGSVALLSSAVDSLLDIVISLFNLFAVREANKKEDEFYNYGRRKIEAVASIFEGIIIIASGFYLLFLAIKRFLYPMPLEYLSESIIVMAISFAFTLLLVIYLSIVVKKTNNMVVKADLLHYKVDLLTNFSIFITLIVVKKFDLVVIDLIMGILIAIYIIKEAFELVKDGFKIILDRSLDNEIVEKIKNIIKNLDKVESFHYLKTRTDGKTNYVDVHLVFNSPDISLKEAHEISDIFEQKVKELDKKRNWYIITHLDPYDDS